MTFKKQLLHPDRCGSCFYLLHSLVKACVNFLIFYGSLHAAASFAFRDSEKACLCGMQKQAF